MPVGIDDMAIYVPRLYIDSKDFAIARGIDPHKLEHGIGIHKMAMVDTNQDPACMAANACLKLMQKNCFFCTRINIRKTKHFGNEKNPQQG